MITPRTYLVGALQPACLAMRENLEGLPPVGGKLIPDNLTTQTDVVRYPLYSRHFTFLVGANQPKAIRDYAETITHVGALQPACLAMRENLEGLTRCRREASSRHLPHKNR